MADLIARTHVFVWGLLVDWVMLLSVFLMLGLQFRPLGAGLLQGLRLLWRSAGQRRRPETLNAYDGALVCLGGMVGAGSILGMARLLSSGGPGAIAWFALAGLVGSSTKFAETYLATRFRRGGQRPPSGAGSPFAPSAPAQSAPAAAVLPASASAATVPAGFIPAGAVLAGPMVYLRDGLSARWRWLSTCFALCGCVAVFGLGSGAQIEALATSLLAGPGLPAWLSGLLVAGVVFMLACGGISRIAGACRYLVPVMLLGYWLACIVLLAAHPQRLGQALGQILEAAFSPGAILHGGLAAMLGVAVTRAVSAAEIGAGTVAIVQGLAQPQRPSAQAGVAVITCLATVATGCLTGLVLLAGAAGAGVGGAVGAGGIGALALGNPELGTLLAQRQLVQQIFNASLTGSAWLVDAGVVLFGFTTMLVHCFIGEQCIAFVAGPRARLPFRAVWVTMLALQALVDVPYLWTLTESLSPLMILPNLLGLALLSTRLFHWVAERPALKGKP